MKIIFDGKLYDIEINKENLNYNSFKNAICKYGYYLKKSYKLIKKENIYEKS